MKKLIVFSVALVLVAGAVFAQPSIGGGFGMQAVLLEGSSAEDSDVNAAGNHKGATANVQFGDGDKFGGKIVLYAAGSTGWWGTNPFAFAWFKPMDILRVQFGHNADGDWGAAQITGWGFNNEAQDFVAVDNDSGDPMGSNWKVARSAGFYGGFSIMGTTLSLAPMDGLTVNVAVPFGDWGHSTGTKLAGETYKRSHLNVVFGIPDIGTLRVSFVGAGGKNEDIDQYNSFGTAYASFYVMAIDNMGIDIGASFGLPYKDDADISYTPAMGIGLGFRLTAGDIGLKARVGATLGGKTGDDKGPTTIGAVILPSISVAGLTAYLNAGFGVRMVDDSDVDPVVDWYLNPYLRKDFGGLRFYAGFKLGSTGIKNAEDKTTVNWSVPVGVKVYF